ncbi:MAG: DUF4349 domain-containing protein [Chloroflexota bacterium]
MRTIRPSVALLALIVITMIAAACAGAASEPVLSDVGNAIGEPATDGGGQDTGGAPVPAASDALGRASGDGVGAPIDDARIIRTGTIDLEVGDVGLALIKARDGIRTMGGYIGASTTQREGDSPVASITYRVPADRWEAALDLLRTISGTGTKVIAERTEAVEVTGQVVDLEARIRNLRASETALQGIAAQAVRVSDVLEVQRELSNVRGQIEQLTAQLADLEDRAAFATLTASFRAPVVAAVEIAQKGWDPKVVVDEASASLVNVLQALTSAGIWFAIVWLPILLVLGVVVAGVTWALRRSGLVGPRRRNGSEVISG